MNNPLNFIDPFGLKERKWWQFWKPKEEPLPETDVLLSEVTVTAPRIKKKSKKKKSNMPGFQMWGESNGSQSTATPTTGNIWSTFDVMEIIDMFGAFFHFKKPGKPSMEEMAGKSGKAALESLNTPDSEIKPDKTDKSGRTANVEKQEQYGKRKYRTWKLTGKNPFFSSFKDPTGDSTLFIPFSGGGRVSTDLNNKE